MESQNIAFRAIIKFLIKGVQTPKKSNAAFSVMCDRSPKYSTVAKWSAELKRRRDSLEDGQMPGRPC